MSPNNDPLIYREEGEIAFIEINRPEKKNALNFECWQLLDRYCDQMVAENQIRALVITGRPDNIFSAGVDVNPTDPFIADMFAALQNRDKVKLFKEICDTTFTMEDNQALGFENERAAENILSGQCIEGISSFLEKRAPPERNIRIKIEVSTREKELKTTIQSLRGVPVLTLKPSFLMTEKLITFVQRQAGRDIFDAWFILNNAFALDETMLVDNFGGRTNFFSTLLGLIQKADSKKVLRDTGKLLSVDQRNWIKTSFLGDFQRLLSRNLKDQF